MSSIEIKPSKPIRVPLSIPAASLNHHPQTAKQTLNSFELSDLDPLATLHHAHQPPAPSPHRQPPSPLITFAPNSPPLSSISLTTSASSSFEDLNSTVKPSPTRQPGNQATAPASSHSHQRLPLSTIDQTYSPNPQKRSLPHQPRTLIDYNRESGPHQLLTSPLIDMDQDLEAGRYRYQSPKAIDAEESDDEDWDMPAGYPYRDWRGIGLLAWEYLKGMQGLLLGFMEQDVRWGGARHTI
ncbi:MAG: hypothetical protein Q9201_007768 [Fulgogasparrea decipioides]